MRGTAAAAWLLALGLLLAPALGVPGEEMLQDTLKSAIVAFAALLAALAFVIAQRRRLEPLRWHAVLWLPIGLMAYALASMAWSHAYLGGVEAVRWFLVTLIAWLALNGVTRERLPVLAGCVHAGAVIASGWAAAQFWGGLGLFPQGPQPASTFVNRNFFAEYAVCTLPFSAWLLARSRTTPRLAALAVGNAFVLAALLMTGTRSALVAAGLLVVVVLPLAAWRCRDQLAFAAWTAGQRALALALLAGTVAVLGSLPTSQPAIVDEGHGATPLARALHRAESISRSDDSLGVRMVMWRATLRAIAAHPLAGLGAGAWENEIPRYQDEGAQLETDYYAHDEYLQLVAEDGIVGWVFLAALLAWLARAGWRTWREEGEDAASERPLRIVFLASVLALLIVSVLGFPWRLAATGALFALCLGGIAGSEARLGRARPLPWSPAIARAALAGVLACLLLAAHITQQAAAAEWRLVRAAQLALGMSSRPDDPVRQQVVQLAREGIALNPHYRKVTPVIADELARRGDWGDAVWIWESVLASRPNIVAVLTNVARGYEMLGRVDQARPYLARARSLQPRSPAVRSLEVLLLARHGQEAEALRQGQQALAEGIVDYDIVNTSFVLAMRAQDYPLAQVLLERRMREWPESRPRGLVQLGVLQDEGFHEPQKALAAFRLGIATAPAAERAQLLQEVPLRYRAQLAGFVPQTSARSR